MGGKEMKKVNINYLFKKFGSKGKEKWYSILKSVELTKVFLSQDWEDKHEYVFWLWKSKCWIMDCKHWENHENLWRTKKKVWSSTHLEALPREDVGMSFTRDGTGKERDLEVKGERWRRLNGERNPGVESDLQISKELIWPWKMASTRDKWRDYPALLETPLSWEFLFWFGWVWYFFLNYWSIINIWDYVSFWCPTYWVDSNIITEW